MRVEHILFGFGILLCIAGIGYLAVVYVKYLSEVGKLVSLLFMIGMFAFLGKYFQKRGW